MLDPFEDVTPPEPMDSSAVLAALLQRSMMWDLVGMKIKDTPDKFGQKPASPDVIAAEHKEMIIRQYSLMPFGSVLPMMCYISAESASQALLAMDEKYKDMSDEEQAQFRAHNVHLGAVVASSVIAHMIQGGLLHYGGIS